MYELKEIGNIGNKEIYEDAEGYRYLYHKTSYSNLKYRGSKPNKFFRNPFTKHNMTVFLRNHNDDIELLSTLEEIRVANSHTKLKFKCALHGEFEMGWNTMVYAQECQKCGYYNTIEKKRNSFEYVHMMCLKNGFILLSKHYGNNAHKLRVLCREHGWVFYVSFGDIISGKAKCEGCLDEIFWNHEGKMTTVRNKRILEKAKEIGHNNSKILKTKVKGRKGYLLVECLICGNVREQKAGHFFNGHMCPNCSPKSIGEESIKKFLRLNDIEYRPEKRFVDCRNKKPLPFDFYIESKNTLIEFDGEQHYKPFSFGSTKDPNEMLAYIQQNDAIKTKYAKDKGIKLIRIPYYDIKKVDEILTKHLL